MDLGAVRSTLIGLCVANALSGSLAYADPSQIPGGFQIGSSLDLAKTHAEANGWTLVALSADLPGTWVVSGTDIGLFICDGMVAAIRDRSPGNLDDFAQAVFDLQIQRGQPEIQVVTFRAGATKVSNVDALFAAVDGISVSVQLSSTDGTLAVSRSFVLEDQCTDG